MTGDKNLHAQGEVVAENGGDFAAIESGLIAAAHELKAPLALIRQLAFQLEDDTLPLSSRQKIARQVRLTAEKSLRLTTDLTKVSRLEDALFVLEPVHPATVCKDVSRELDEYFRAHGKVLRVQDARKLPLIIAHRELLRRVLTVFSDNALQYGGDEIVLSLKKQSPMSVRIAVRDYGPALSLQDFYQIKKRLARPQAVHSRPGSSGLGLYIASQFAAAMHGSIGITRHRDGVSFYVDMRASQQLPLL